MADANSTSISSISPNPAPSGASIDVKGSIGTTDGDYRLCWNNPEAKPLATGRAKGNKVNETVSVPNVECGEHHLILLDDSTKDSGGLKFTVIPSLTIQPDKGPAGTTVDVKGANFRPGPVRIHYDGKEVTKATSSTRKTFHVVFQVPVGPAGDYRVSSDPPATDQVFRQTPAIAVVPDSGAPETDVTVTGTGFVSGKVSIMYDGAEVASATPDDRGEFQVTFPIPAGEAGIHEVTTSPPSLKVEFTVCPKPSRTISVKPDTGKVGTQITVKGENFDREGEVILTFGGTEVAALRTDKMGSVSATFEVAPMPGGSYVIASRPASTEVVFNMLPGISIGPETGPVGTEIEVKGSGFAPGQRIEVFFDGERKLTADSDEGGSFVTGLVVHRVASGKHSVTTSPASGDATFKVTPQISIDPIRGPAGTAVSVSGSGFPAEGLIGLKYDGREAAKAMAGKDGSFQATLVAWAGKAAVHSITTDPTSTEEVFIMPQFTMEPLVGPVGTEISLRGSGFAPEQRISIRYDDKEVCSAVSDSLGHIATEFSVWACSIGEHRITTEPASSEYIFTLVPSMFLEPESGPVGSEVQIAGRGFMPEETVSIKFGNRDSLQVMVDASGSFCQPLAVPASPGGKHTISTSPAVTEQLFTVLPSLIMEPVTGPVGTETRLQACGFEPGSEVAIKYDGRHLVSLVPDSDGNQRCDVRIPPSCLGEHKVVTQPASVEQVFTVFPDVALAPSSGPVGSTVTVLATGFHPHQELHVMFDESEMANMVTDEYGKGEASFAIPTVLGGRHLVSLRQTLVSSVERTFHVTPKISSLHDGGHVGFEVKVAATGFDPGRRTSIIFDNKEVAASIADNRGTLETSFQVPATVAGQHKLSSEPPSSEEYFQVLPMMAIKPLAGNIGTEVDVNGTGFEPGRSIAICYDGREVSRIAADRSGSFDTCFTVPPCTGGDHKVSSDPPSSEAVFHARPSIVSGPASGPVGTAVLVMGTGFPAGRRISVRLDSVEVATINAGEDGSFSETFTVPEASTGLHRITTEPYSAVGTFEILPHFVIEPSQGKVGSTLSVVASGFAATKRVAVHYGDREAGTAVTDARGSFKYDLRLPPGGAGRHGVSTEPPSIDADVHVIPAIEMSSSAGPVGSGIEISGSGHVPGKRVSIRYDDVESVAVTASHDGVFHATVAVPASTAGEHRVTTEPASSELVYTVTPVFKIKPDSGLVGAEIAVEGHGFAAGRRVSLDYDGRRVVDAVADTAGSFQACFEVPPSARGPHRIASEPASVEEIFKVVPAYSLSAQWGFAGSEMRFRGSGFAGESRIAILYDGNTVAHALTDRDGCVSTSFLVPASVTGEHRIATDPASQDMVLTVLPKLEVEKDRGPVGTDVAVVGTGFPGNRRISVRYDDAEVGVVAADATGSFRTSFTSPASTAGEHRITTAPPSKEKQFHVVPIIRLQPVSGLVGSEASVSGSGFAAGSRVCILFDGEKVAETVADTSGGFVVVFAIPDSGRGRHQVSTDPPANIEGFDVHSTINIDSIFGPVGTRVEVDGTGFPAQERVFVRYDDQEVTTLVAGSDGSFRTAIIIPPSVAGRHNLTTDPVSVERRFDVTPSFAIYPDNGKVGTEVTMVGTGFPSGTVMVRYDADQILMVETDSRGNFEASFLLPPGVAGEHYVTTRLESASRSIVVTPRIYLDCSSGTAGSELNVRGTGFPAGHVSVRYDYKEVVTARADDRGDFHAAFQVPPGIAGEYRVTTWPASTVEAFILIPQITLLEPVHGAVGTPVTIQGENFVPGKTVSILFDGIELVTAMPDRDGDFQAVFMVPNATGGKHRLTTDPASTSEVFHMVSRLVTEPATGPVGTELTVTGTGFAQGVHSVRFDGSHVATVLVDDRGCFRTAFAVPASIAGEHRITTSQMRVSQA